MILKADKLHLKKLLADAIPLLCKNGLPLHSMFRVEAMIGITVDDGEVALICFKETVTSDGELLPQVYGVDEDVEENDEPEIMTPAEAGDHSVGSLQTRNGSGCRMRISNNRGYSGSEMEDSNAAYLQADLKPEHRTNEAANDPSGYHDSGHETSLGNYLYNGNMAESGGYDMHGTLTSTQDNHTVGSDQIFVKEEVDLDVDDCLVIKEEHAALDPASYPGSFAYGLPSVDIPTKSKANTRTRVPHMYQDFPNRVQNSFPANNAGQRRAKNFGPVRNRKVPGSANVGLPTGKVPRSAAPAAAVDLRSQGSSHGYSTMIQGLCDSILQQSTQNGDQFVCHICEAKLSNATTLRNHIRGTHLALKTERCNICGESFKWAMQLARHKKREHGDGSFIQIYNTVQGGTSEMAPPADY